MKYSKLVGKTSRQKLPGSDAVSHQLLLRAGFITPVAAGIYSFLPLGYRVLEKVDQMKSDYHVRQRRSVMVYQEKKNEDTAEMRYRVNEQVQGLSLGGPDPEYHNLYIWTYDTMSYAILL